MCLRSSGIKINHAYGRTCFTVCHLQRWGTVATELQLKKYSTRNGWACSLSLPWRASLTHTGTIRTYTHPRWWPAGTHCSQISTTQLPLWGISYNSWTNSPIYTWYNWSLLDILSPEEWRVALELRDTQPPANPICYEIKHFTK